MLRGLRELAVVVTASSIAGCSLLLLDGFTSPGEGAADAADDRADGDGDGDAVPRGDAAGEPSDATSDAGIRALCEAGPKTFCDDFERLDVRGSWRTAHATEAGTLEIVPGPGSPGGRRLQAACPSRLCKAELSSAFVADTPSRVHFALTLEYADVPTLGDVYIGGIAMVDGSGTSLVYLYASQGLGIVFVQQQTSSAASYRGEPIPALSGAPHRIVVDAVFQGNVRVSVDGAMVIDRAVEPYLIPAPPVITLGASTIDENGGGFTSLIDDFVFSFE